MFAPPNGLRVSGKEVFVAFLNSLAVAGVACLAVAILESFIGIDVGHWSINDHLYGDRGVISGPSFPWL